MKRNPSSHPFQTASVSSAAAARTSLDWAFDAGTVDRVLAQVEVRVQRKRRRTALRAVALACVALGGLWAVPWMRETSEAGTPASQRRTIVLMDGSQVELNARSSIHTDFRFGRRTVRLERGEAYFAVAKDPTHPFLVETEAGTVRVTGTHFNVRLTADHGAEVTLMEGSVAVQTIATPSVNLVPGQRAEVAVGRAEVCTLSAAELENASAWRQGRLALDGLTLADAAERIAAYHNRVITVAPAVAGLHMGGSCPIDNLESLFAAVETTLSVRVLPRDDGSYYIEPARR